MEVNIEIKESHYVSIITRSYQNKEAIAWHYHQVSQLVYACSGVMVIETNQNLWVIPPQRAVWVPANERHKITMYGHAEMRNVYINPNQPIDLPLSSTVINVSPLLKELINYVVDYSCEGVATEAFKRLSLVLLEQIKASDQTSFFIPLPKNPKLIKICQALITQPANATSLTEWANSVNISSRSLSRLFQKEFGLSFVDYRQQVRLYHSLLRLADGASVTTTALDVGFNSVSAFNHLFKRYFSCTPGSFFTNK